MKKRNKTISDKPTIKKNDFIDFLANATPEEVSRYIMEKGKKQKLVNPVFFFNREEDNKSVD